MIFSKGILKGQTDCKVGFGDLVMNKMLKVMITGLVFFSTLFLPPATFAREKTAVCVVIKSGGLGRETIETARGLLCDEVSGKGYVILEPEGSKPVMNLKEALKVAKDEGADKLFALKLHLLGKKIIAVVVEYNPTSGRQLYSARLTCLAVEELEEAIPRLVDAVVKRRKIEDTAEVDTVTAKESAPYRKKHGEFLWGLGLKVSTPLRADYSALYGFGLKLGYEMKFARIDIDLAGGAHPEREYQLLMIGLSGYWLPLAEWWTPFIGGGLSYTSLRSEGPERIEKRYYTNELGDQQISLNKMTPIYDGHGLSIFVSGGMEFFRLHDVRLLAEARLILPCFLSNETTSTDDIKGDNRWVPFFDFGLSLLW